MINSLVVKNFKCLENLEIRNLNRINLITGKNNTGKSTLLESIALFASKGDLEVLHSLFEIRGVTFVPYDQSANIEKIAGLFSKWHQDFSENGAVQIGEIDSLSNRDSLLLRLVKFIENYEDSADGPVRRRILIDNDNLVTSETSEISFGLQKSFGEFITTSPLEFFGRKFPIRNQQIGGLDIQFVRSDKNTDNSNSKLWDKITLTSKEIHIIEALKIIHPSISGLSFVEVGRNRVPIAKLTDLEVVVPLRSMGDGMNKILTLLLALVNVQDGVILIDEFENGLHYSVQKQLWSMIFKLSLSLNVQVFATTHSTDCIDAFTSVMADSEDMNIGALIRLENKAGNIESVEYSPEELKIAKQYDLETR